MRARYKAGGYTIIEVMIFMAVSGFMFVIAAIFINGKQNQSQFRQSMNDLAGQFQQVINDVGSGYYQSNGDFQCSSDVSGGAPVISAGSAQQGANQGCVFIGKVMQFNTADGGGALNPRGYTVYSIVGRQTIGAAGTATPTSFVQARPTIIDLSNITETGNIQWGTEVTKIFEGSPANPIGAIGFFGSFGAYSSSSLVSGSQTTVVVTLPPGPSTAQTKADVAAALSAGTPPGSTLDTRLAGQPNPDITICLDSKNGLYGKITIGSGNGQRLVVQSKTGNSLADLGCE